MRIGLLSLAAGLTAVVASTAAAGPPPLAARASPSAPAFGDPFVYSVVVTVPSGVDPGAVRISAPTGSFTPMAAPERRTSAGVSGETVELRQSLACLAAGCAPFDGSRRVPVPTATAVVAGRRLTAPGVVVEIQPRVAAAAVERDRPTFRRGAPTAPGERDVPAAALAIAGAGALLLGGLAIVGGRHPRRRQRAAADPIARARRLLLESAARSATARRRAASLAARVTPDDGLAADAQRVAWSPPDPEPHDTAAIAHELRTSSDAVP
jgi:hypothetical protein